MKKTRIVATIGPTSDTPEVLKKLYEAGVNVFRLNFSHGTHEEHGKKIDRIRALNTDAGIMLDTKGPEIRTGEVRDFFEVKTGDTFTFTIEKGVYEDMGKLGVNYEKFIDDIDIGDTIVIDSGAILVEVESKTKTDAVCKVIYGSGKITSRRHINLFGKKVSLETVTENDWKDIDFGIQKKVDFIALSFVRTAEDVVKVREYCISKGHPIKIIPKIENFEAMQNLEEIVKESDGVMVARGDLACEIPFSKVPSAQREIVELCKMYNKPVIIATQMLLSMTENIRPTRAEVMDVSTAIFDGSDAVMLSDESAKGFDPVNVVKTMAEIARDTEEDMSEGRLEIDYDNEETKEAFARYIGTIASETDGIDAIAVLDPTDEMAGIISNNHSDLPVYYFVNNEAERNQLQLFWGALPHKIDFAKDTNETISNMEKELKKEKISRYVLLADLGTESNPAPTIQIRYIK